MNKQPVILTCLAAIIITLAIISVIAPDHVHGGGQYSGTGTVQTPAKVPPEEPYKEILLVILDPYVQQAVEQHYGSNVFAPPYMIQIIEAKKPSADRAYTYEIKLRVDSYTGAHITVGTDNITLLVDPFTMKGDDSFNQGKCIEVVKFEHIKSYELPPYLPPLPFSDRPASQ